MMMKIHTMNCFNSIIRGINRLGEELERMQKDYTEEGEREAALAAQSIEEIVQDEFHSLDISFKILCGHLERIASHAIDTNDAKLIGICQDMHIIKPGEKS